MLRIRQEQIDQMRVSSDEEFNRATARFYRTKHPAFVRNLSDQELAQHISDGLETAPALGISRSDSATRYVALAILAGPSFTSNQKIRAFLESPGMTPDQKFAIY